MRFTRMNCLCWDMRTETVQMNKMCVIGGKQVCNEKRLRRPIRTQTITANKPCVLWAIDCRYTIVRDWWNITDGFHCLVHVRRDFLCPHNIYALSTEYQHIYLKRQHCITKLSIQLHKWLHTQHLHTPKYSLRPSKSVLPTLLECQTISKFDRVCTEIYQCLWTEEALVQNLVGVTNRY